MKLFLILLAIVVGIIAYLSFSRPAAEEKARSTFESLAINAASRSYGHSASGNKASSTGTAVYDDQNAVPSLEVIRTALLKEGWETADEKHDQDGSSVVARKGNYEVRISTKGRELYFESKLIE